MDQATQFVIYSYVILFVFVFVFLFDVCKWGKKTVITERYFLVQKKEKRFL